MKRLVEFQKNKYENKRMKRLSGQIDDMQGKINKLQRAESEPKFLQPVKVKKRTERKVKEVETHSEQPKQKKEDEVQQQAHLEQTDDLDKELNEDELNAELQQITEQANNHDVDANHPDPKDHVTNDTQLSRLSNIKGLETAERVKLLMKRSMSADKLRLYKHDMEGHLKEMAEEVAAQMAAREQEKVENRHRRVPHSELDRLKSLNNPLAKVIDQDAVSNRSNASSRTGKSMVDTSKTNN